MRASEICINAIKSFEDLRLRAYKCPADVLTIGYGHIRGVKNGQIITLAQANSLLKGDLLSIETYLNKLGILKTQGQFDAICDFCFNLGIGKFISSTLYKVICRGGSDEEVETQFMKWVYSGGKPLNGLIKRREWEAQQWKRK
jgi:lysozyme